MLDEVAALAFPGRCPGCGGRGEPVCAACARTLRRPGRVVVPPGLDALHVAFAYDGVARELVARVKYRGVRHAVGFLAGALADVVPSGVAFGALVPLPTTPARRRERGFDHAELLALALARRLDVPVRRLLRRRPGPAQTGLDRHARRRGPAFALRTSPPDPARGALLLVDDVTTTGATMTSAAVTLRAMFRGVVHGVCAARTS